MWGHCLLMAFNMAWRLAVEAVVGVDLADATCIGLFKYLAIRFGTRVLYHPKLELGLQCC
jgi:hypothetical protein